VLIELLLLLRLAVLVLLELLIFVARRLHAAALGGAARRQRIRAGT